MHLVLNIRSLKCISAEITLNLRINQTLCFFEIISEKLGLYGAYWFLGFSCKERVMLPNIYIVYLAISSKTSCHNPFSVLPPVPPAFAGFTRDRGDPRGTGLVAVRHIWDQARHHEVQARRRFLAVGQKEGKGQTTNGMVKIWFFITFQRLWSSIQVRLGMEGQKRA